MIKKIFTFTLICCSVIVSVAQVNPGKPDMAAAAIMQKAGSVSKQKDSAQIKDKADTTSKLSAYEKLFDKKKSVQTSAGVITLHNIEGKLYFELPVKLIGKSFLMSSVVDNVSNMSLSYAGQRASRPLHVCFSKTDSLVQIRLVPLPRVVDKEGSGIAEAVRMSSLPAVLTSRPIVAYNSDSSAVVFDATPFFISDSKYISNLNAASFGGFIQKVSTFSKDLSALKEVEAYDDNVAIISDMTYTFKTFFLGMESGGTEYLTVELRTTLTLLPQENFRYRYADYRIGTGVTEFERFNSREQGSDKSYLANRWRLEPANREAYFSGQLTKPTKPIIFYVDTLFAPSWREAVKRGLLKWNGAFEKIGFKDVIEVYDYPSKSADPKFSASNISYNCVRFAQSASRNIGRQVNVDPRSGEILSAAILFFRDSPVTLQRERLYQTAAVEPGVRGYQLPDSLLCSSIELAMTREMGYCLGLVANLAGSSWMPVDSLRSASFTAKEGITSSVMDQIKYNYIAQPGDIERGVKLTADKLGVYDIYAIDWLYRPLPVASPALELPVLRQMIASKINDPRYFYGKEQNFSAYFDPRSVIEDLGDDKIKAAKYGIETLKYISNNATGWVNKDEADESYRELFIDFIFLKIYDYYRTLMVNIGGIEINRRYEGDPVPSYKLVDKNIQRESLLFMLNQAQDFEWVNNRDLLMMSGMTSSFSDYLANNMVKLVFQRIPMVAFSQNKALEANMGAAKGGAATKRAARVSKSEVYTVDEMLGDIIDFSLTNIKRGTDPTEAQISTLFTTVQLLLNGSNLPAVIDAKAKNKSAFQFTEDQNYLSYHNVRSRCFPNELFLKDSDPEPAQFQDPLLYLNNTLSYSETSSFETLTSLRYLVGQDLSATYYKHLISLRKELKSSLRRAKTAKSKDRIKYLILSIDKGLAK
ncbi:MAG: zinc-dependent metalloprotease [Bacteroidales bacterium]|nr:zinc-dependent metalloprotease [Bacteroidales bacterium]